LYREYWTWDVLHLQEEGLQSFLNYLKELISKRAEEDYSALVENSGQLLSPSTLRTQKACATPHHKSK